MKNRTSSLFTRLLAFLFVMGWSVSSAHATSSLFIGIGSLSYTEGQSFSVMVNITGVTDLYSFQFDLGFDPGVLQANNIYEGAFLPGGGPTLYIPGTIDNTAGTISNTADSLQSSILGVSGSGALAVVNFTALAAGSSGINLFGPPILLDSQGSDIAFDILQSPTVTVNPRPTGTTPEPSSFFLLGIGLAGLRLNLRRRVNQA